MPIAPSKWRKRSEKKSTEQRARAKRRAFSRDDKGRFCREVNRNLARDLNDSLGVLPIKESLFTGDYNSLLNNPITIRGMQYQVDHIQSQYSSQYFANQVQLHMTPVYPTYIRAVPNSLYTTYGGTMAYTSELAWQNWTMNPVSTTFQTQTYNNPEITWTGWINDLNGFPQQIESEWDRHYEAQQRTPEQIEADQIRQDQQRHQLALHRAEQDRVHAAAREAQDAASQRALATFVEVLNEQEREAYEKEKCIYVRSQHGRRYRIRCTKGQSGNVELLDDHGKATAGFCVHPAYDRSTGHLLPDADAWVTQKLFLEHDEDQFLKVANLTKGRRPGPPRLITPGQNYNVGNVLVNAA